MDVANEYENGSSKSTEYTHEWHERQRGVSETREEKAVKILAACEGNGNLERLIQLSTSRDGLLNDKLRQNACR